MRIGLFTNFYLLFIVLVLSLLILLSSQALGTLDDITRAERQKHKSLQLANELFQSSENLTKMARSYVITGDSIYERFFFEILDIRNGKQSRPRNYPITYWNENFHVRGPLDPPVALIDLMRREGFSERELDLLQQSQKNSDNLVNLEKQAFAAIKGLCADRAGNFTRSCPTNRAYAIDLLFGERYKAEKVMIMAPINQFMLELDNRTHGMLEDLQSKFQQQIVLMLAVLFAALLVVAIATIYMRQNILRPLYGLRRQASSIAQGSYATRCDISTHNEIAELGADFNTMAEAIEHEIIKLKRVEESLRERLKEINCFYAIRRGLESGSLEDVCRTIFVELIGAMQYPSITTIEIELDGKRYTSDEGAEHPKRELRKHIAVYGQARGWIAVYYSEDRPFLPDEQNLIDVTGDDLGRWLEHKQAEARLLVEQELRVRDAAIREFAAHVERMREEDRKYIAREIHDELGQLLAALHLEISLLRWGEDPHSDRVESIRRNMFELVHRADQSVRSVAEHLRPASLGLGIVSALKKLIVEFKKHSGVGCVLQLMDEPVGLDEDQTIAIFRIVQESLTNVTRHAEANRVDINLSQSINNIVVEVRDNGKGFDPESASRKKSFGLLGMRERAAMLGGNIDIISSPQQGTTVRVCIPMKSEEGFSDSQVPVLPASACSVSKE